MPSYLETFRKKTNNEACLTKSKKTIISQSTGKTNVILLRNNKKLTVNLILADKKEGEGTAIIYCDPEDAVAIGDYFKWNEYIYLITKQEKNVLLNNTIKKFTARECNVKFKFKPKNDVVPLPAKERYAVYLGATSASTEVYKWINNMPFVSAAKDALLIFSELDDIDKHDIIEIGNNKWTITEYDNLTANPIVFATVKRIASSEQFETSIPVLTQEFHAGVTYEFATEDYYFSSLDVQPEERTEKIIKIRMPKKDSITFEVKENGFFTEKTIKIT